MDNFADLLAMLKTILGIDSADTSRDAELTDLLNGTIVRCETYIDNVISQRNVSELFYGASSPFNLNYYPVGDIVSVELNGSDVAIDWEVRKRFGLGQLRRKDGRVEWLTDDDEIAVTYEAGFAECPYDLMQAIAHMAAATDPSLGPQGSGRVKRETITGIGSVEYDFQGDGIPPVAKPILDKYVNYGA